MTDMPPNTSGYGKRDETGMKRASIKNGASGSVADPSLQVPNTEGQKFDRHATERQRVWREV